MFNTRMSASYMYPNKGNFHESSTKIISEKSGQRAANQRTDQQWAPNPRIREQCSDSDDDGLPTYEECNGKTY